MNNTILLFDNVCTIKFKYKPEGKKRYKTNVYAPKDFKVYRIAPKLIYFTDLDNVNYTLCIEYAFVEFQFLG